MTLGIVRVAITGAAGFVGFHLIRRLRDAGSEIAWASDSISPSYGAQYAERRAEMLEDWVSVDRTDLAVAPVEYLQDAFHKVDVVIHLAAWPGVRFGESETQTYLRNNVVSFQNVLGAAEFAGVPVILFASSSSIYGDAGAYGPTAEDQVPDTQPKSFYGLTKWMNELQARDFVRRSGLTAVALRFFTIYGPYGRPDMLYWRYVHSLLGGPPVSLYGPTGGLRNYTNVSDTVEVLARLVASRGALQERGIDALNVAVGSPSTTIDFLDLLARGIGQPAPQLAISERPLVDAEGTWADLTRLKSLINLPEETPLAEGAEAFAAWLASELDK